MVGLQPTLAGSKGDIEDAYRKHIDTLWDEFFTFCHTLTASRYLSHLPATNPFAEWKVEHRYYNDAHFSLPDAQAHQAAATAVLLVLQLAKLDGVI
jgi:hypothetical protein